MKKFLFGFLTLALVTTSAFADLTIGGRGSAGVSLISATELGDDWATTTVFAPGRTVGDASWGNTFKGFLQAEYSNDDGSFGALVRAYSPAAGGTRMWAWWKPLDVLKLSIGQEANGQFGNNFIVGWGFHGTDAEDYVAYNGYNLLTRYAAWYVGFDDFRAWLELTPVEGLAINVGVPYKQNTRIDNVYKDLDAQISYNIAGVGQAAVTFIGGLGVKTKTTDATWEWDETSQTVVGVPATSEKTGDPFAIQGQFHLTAIENLGVIIGFKYTADQEKTEKTITHAPIAIGLGLSYAVNNEFGIKFRLGTTLLGNTTFDGEKVAEDPFAIGADIEPYYDLGIMKFFFNAGFQYTAERKEWVGGSLESVKDSSQLAWYVNPYIVKSVGAASFYAGIQFGGAPDAGEPNKDHMFVAVPIGLQVNF